MKRIDSGISSAYGKWIMVGGVIIGLQESQDGVVHVHIADCPHYPRHARGCCPRPDTCCVYTDAIIAGSEKRAEMSIGDSFWWQSGNCYWTPQENRDMGDEARCGIDYDVRLKKIGYSH